jgi:solute carrier family 44 (choline transporter-like protein), member 2/4/5
VVPTIGFLIISLVIGSLFMNVYGMAVDAILLCYIADSELHRHEGGAKSVPESLKEFLVEYS